VARLPWYAFLYRLFGAQGTFWLWIVCLIALWWTAKPTLHRVANRAPTPGLRVADVATTHSATDLTRWVELSGVEVTYDPELLCKDAHPSSQTPVRLLIDPRDNSARWWTTTRALADAVRAGEGVELEGLGRLTVDQVRRELVRRFADLEGGKVPDARPTPEQALVILSERPPPRPSPVPPAPADPILIIQWLDERFDARVARVRERVTPATTVMGLLVPMPETLAERVKARVDVNVGRWVIQEGKEPRDLESWIFGVAAIILVFLATGFYGAVRTQRQVAP
jgi:hypothetical protein